MTVQSQYFGQLINNGAIVAYPSDSVWGLGCHPYQEQTVRRLIALKQRPWQKGLILLVDKWERLGELYDCLTNSQKLALSQNHAQPTTWLIPHFGLMPAWICGEFDTVAVRQVTKPSIVNLCQSLKAPLVSTSANLSGKATCRNRWQVIKEFGTDIDAILPGDVAMNAQASRIINLNTMERLR